ncbi:hypothetical protein SAMN05519103_01919 [Rhizobiales bacterium GAS113]|nr:hypothetical protein SAMN05519103_01919 [Rhizobiales bacterium GAS113]
MYPFTPSNGRAMSAGVREPLGRMVPQRTARGNLVYVWEPPVPRIHDAYLDCVIYLYPSKVDAEDGTRAGGSGFLVSVPSEGLPQNFLFIYAVTNMHVANRSRFIRLNTSDGRKDIIAPELISWCNHPDGDDLSACLISVNPKDFRFSHVPRSMFVSEEIVERYKIGPGDDVFIVGRFLKHEGRQQNIPTARFAILDKCHGSRFSEATGSIRKVFFAISPQSAAIVGPRYLSTFRFLALGQALRIGMSRKT